MIKIHYTNGRNVPIMSCDICGTWIEDAGEAAAVFCTPKGNGDTVEVLHVHKRGCHDAAELRLGGRRTCSWEELGTHMLNLTHNTGLPVERLAEIAGRRDEFDL